MQPDDFPNVKLYRRAAFMHYESASLLLALCPARSSSLIATETMYLSGYVAECGMKALLFAKTPFRKHPELMREMLQVIRHDIEELKRRLQLKGVSITQKQMEAIRYVRRNWSSEMRYDASRRSTAQATDVFGACELIYRWTCKE